MIKKQTTLKVLIATAITVLLTSCGTNLKIPIEKGKIDGGFTITIPSRNITLKPGEFFKLNDVNLSANGGQISKKTLQSTDIKSALKLFKKQKIRNYEITITLANGGRPYYGKIAFFNTNKINEADAVARYYEINIADSYFNSATRGRVAIIYEYSSMRTSIVAQSKIPTWIIIMSDEPL